MLLPRKIRRTTGVAAAAFLSFSDDLVRCELLTRYTCIAGALIIPTTSK